MKNKIKRLFMGFFAVVVLGMTIVPSNVFAVSIDVGRSDVYSKLDEAMQVNVIANTVYKCLDMIPSEPKVLTDVLYGSNVLKGNIFYTFAGEKTRSTALWLENSVGAAFGSDGHDGKIFCYETDGQTVFKKFADITGLSIPDMLCNEGKHRLLHRAADDPDDTVEYYYLANDVNCSSFSDSNAFYLASTDVKSQFEKIYNDWRAEKIKENPYIPTYSEVGSFDNVDGYFSYIRDFAQVCEKNAEVVDAKDKASSTTYYPVTRFEKDGNKLVAKNKYYHLKSSSSWSAPLAVGGPTSCSGLLERTQELKSINNGIVKGSRDGGYEDILVAELKDACKTAVTENEGEIKTKLQEIIDGSGSDEERAKAQEQLDNINKGVYVTESGDYDDDEGKIYQCSADINVENYDYTDVAGSTDTDCMGLDLSGQNWILCPTLENSANMSDGFMGIIDGMLSVNSDLYDDSSGTRKAWEFFRNIANIALIIVLLVIIFSQITGYGINNYGIKKMLPKFVVMAILINLSFLLCQIAVDISNILGDGLNNLLQSIASSVGMSSTLGSGNVASTIVGGLLAALAAGGAVAGFAVPFAGIGLGAGALIVIGLILALLVALVSILMFFVMLGARIVIVIAFIAIAPVALVCYILPNTQTLFKKWWNVFKAALVMYPLCGLLYGLSFLIKAIFSGSGDIGFWEGIVLLITPFLPFLVLPNLLKGALAGLGVIGGAITSVGNGLRHGTQGASQALQNSNAFKAQQEKGRRLADLKNSGIQFDKKTGEIMKDKDGNVMTKDVGRVRKFLRGGDSGVAKARARVLDNERTKAMEDRLTSGTGLTAAVMSQGKAAKDAEVADYMTLLKDRTNDGAEEDVLWGMFDGYLRAGDESGMKAAIRIAGRRKDTAGRFMEHITGFDGKGGGYNSAMLKNVAKEMAEGENSGNFRSATPLSYEYMSQLNRATTNEEGRLMVDGGEMAGDYSSWVGDSGNIHSALDHHIGTRSDLLSAKKSQLDSIAKLIQQGAMDEADATAMRKLALESIETSRKNGTELDVTKVDEIYRIAYGEEKYEVELRNDGYRDGGGSASGGTQRIEVESGGVSGGNNIPQGFEERDSGLIVPRQRK